MKNFKLSNIGHPEKDWARIKMRVITFFFISFCNLVGYWPLCKIRPHLKIELGKKLDISIIINRYLTDVFGVKE